ncbi:MAG: DUF244 domain-containing protein [Helicobacter sp.]|nr:DUF244 domain-containing protein [Helicobacter sp.]
MTIVPTLWVMALVFVVFIALVYLLNKVLYRPLLQFMDAREDSIKRDNEGIRGDMTEIKALQEEIERILESAKKEASLIKERAQQNAKQNAEMKIAQKQEELNNKYQEFILNLESQKSHLRESLFAQIPDFRQTLANKLSRL